MCLNFLLNQATFGKKSINLRNLNFPFSQKAFYLENLSGFLEKKAPRAPSGLLEKGAAGAFRRFEKKAPRAPSGFLEKGAAGAFRLFRKKAPRAPSGSLEKGAVGAFRLFRKKAPRAPSGFLEKRRRGRLPAL